MAVARIGDDRNAPRRGRNEVEDDRERFSCFARNANAVRRGRKLRTAVADNDRGEAGLRSDMPHRAREGRGPDRDGRNLDACPSSPYDAERNGVAVTRANLAAACRKQPAPAWQSKKRRQRTRSHGLPMSTDGGETDME